MSQRGLTVTLLVCLLAIAGALTFAVTGPRDGCSHAGLTGYFGYTPLPTDRVDPEACDIIPVTRVPNMPDRTH